MGTWVSVCVLVMFFFFQEIFQQPLREYTGVCLPVQARNDEKLLTILQKQYLSDKLTI